MRWEYKIFWTEWSQAFSELNLPLISSWIDTLRIHAAPSAVPCLHHLWIRRNSVLDAIGSKKPCVTLRPRHPNSRRTMPPDWVPDRDLIQHRSVTSEYGHHTSKNSGASRAPTPQKLTAIFSKMSSNDFEQIPEIYTDLLPKQNCKTSRQQNNVPSTGGPNAKYRFSRKLLFLFFLTIYYT
jgi:hypothetical protein